jgi:hypothetical protein
MGVGLKQPGNDCAGGPSQDTAQDSRSQLQSFGAG